MIINMVTEFKVTVVNTRCRSVHALGKKNVENQHWATGPLSRRGPWAARPRACF